MMQMNRYFAAAGSLAAGLAIAFVMQASSGDRGANTASMMPAGGQPAAAPLEISDVSNTAAVAPAETALPALETPPVVTVAADAGLDDLTPETGPAAPARWSGCCSTFRACRTRR